MLPPEHLHPTLDRGLGGEAHLADCSSILWAERPGFMVSRSPLLEYLRPMPSWYSRVCHRRRNRGVDPRGMMTYPPSMTTVNPHPFAVGDSVKVDFSLDRLGECPCGCGRSTSYVGTVVAVDHPRGPTVADGTVTVIKEP